MAAAAPESFVGVGSLGQHLRVKRYGVGRSFHLYDHHAIISNVEGTRCVQFTSLNWWAPLKVQETDIDIFLWGAKREDVEVVWQSTNYAPMQIVERARSQLGHRGYQFFGDNCEAFANWCVTGRATSDQALKLSESLRSLHARLATDVSKRLQLLSARAIALYPSSRKRTAAPAAAAASEPSTVLPAKHRPDIFPP
jgi:hypothetical protein